MSYRMIVSDGQNETGHIQNFNNAGSVNPVNYTWEVWFRPDDLTTGDFVIMGIDQRNPNSVVLGCTPDPDTGGAQLFVELAGERHPLLEVSLQKPGEWYHVALVHQDLGSGKGEFRLYVFGREYRLFNTNQHSMPTASYMYVGAAARSSMFGARSSMAMKGAVDELRIWSVSRTEQEIKAGMSTRIPASVADGNPNLVAYIDFDSAHESENAKGGYEGDATGHSNQLYLDHATVMDTTNIDRKDGFDGDVLVGGPKHALSFPGAKDCYVSIPSSRALDFDNLDGLTVDVWVKPSATLAPSATQYYTVVHKESTFWLGIKVSSRRGRAMATLCFIINTQNGSALCQTAGSFPVDQWHHLAICSSVYKSGNDTEVDHLAFLDGRQVEFDATPDVDVVLNPDAHDLRIGASENDQGGKFQPFKGLITELRIWRKDLSLPPPDDANGPAVINLDDYRWSELPYEPPQVDLDADPVRKEYQTLTCRHDSLLAYYKFDHGKAGQDNTTPQRVNWMRDHSEYRNHGRLSAGFALTGTDSNWVKADLNDEDNDEYFRISSTFGNSNVPPESGLLLQSPKLYGAATDPLQPRQTTTRQYSKNEWEHISGLYLLVNVKPNDVLVMTLNARRLHSAGPNAGVAVGIAVEGEVENRSGIYYEGAVLQPEEQTGGMCLQYVYRVPADFQGLMEVRGVFSSYGSSDNVAGISGNSNRRIRPGISELDVMVYTPIKA